MTAYFVPTNIDHAALLPKSLRSHDDMPAVAAQVERDVIQEFTRRLPPMSDVTNQFGIGRGYAKGNGFYVGLVTFRPDASDPSVDPDLVIALRDTIAEVITWRLAKIGEAGLVFSGVSTAVGASKQFRDDFRSKFPPRSQWASRLRPWDIRAPLYTT